LDREAQAEDEADPARDIWSAQSSEKHTFCTLIVSSLCLRSFVGEGAELVAPVIAFAGIV
jgi:hypothetical protein